MKKYPIDVNTENFEIVTVFDYPMLFTCLRCDRSTIPKGMYLYEVRHDDDSQGIPCEIADRITVNHWGTLISNRPIRLTERPEGQKPYRLINEETDWNYLGEFCSLQEYMSKFPPKKERSYDR